MSSIKNGYRDNIAEHLKLYAITAVFKDKDDLLKSVTEACEGGISILQFRAKHLGNLEFLEQAKLVQAVARKYEIPFIINNRIDVALELNADGVHIGQSDLEISKARKLLGNSQILGVSAHTPEQAQKASGLGADYLGVGAVYKTFSKDDATTIGLETMKETVGAVEIPCVAIGGLNLENLHTLKGSGIKGVALISAIFASDNISKAAKNLSIKIDEIIN